MRFVFIPSAHIHIDIHTLSMHIRYNSLTLELVNGRYLYFTKVILVYFSTGKRYMFTYINMLFFIQIIIIGPF